MSGTIKRRMIALLAAAAMMPAMSGCATDATKGYTTASQYRSGVQTIAVELFTRSKNVYRRNLTSRLTEAVVKRIQLDTPYRIEERGKADTLLKGTIESVGQRVMSYDTDTGSPRDMEMIITVTIEWLDLRSDRVYLDNVMVRGVGAYLPATGFEEDFFQGSEAAFNDLAKRVVEKLEADW